MAIERTDWERLAGWFSELTSLPPNERAQRLGALAASEPTLYPKLLELISADSKTGGLLDVPLPLAASELLAEDVARSAPSAPPALAQGTRVGAYEIERELGRGGMGVVYLARRADGAYDQQVALKVLPGGAAGALFTARFLQERKILARLQHPNIARLLDAGTTAGGAPYFVMEYVCGEPIIEWVRRDCPPVGERLEVFLAVLDAVQYAHRNLVIHCDLKPGNILITPEREVRLLDFGIARLLAEPQDDSEGGSEISALTPAYAAPELLQGGAPAIDCDIYSLGAVLYEMLSTIKANDGLAGRRRATGETGGPTPFDCLPGLDAAGRRRLRGDLTAIVQRAMAADPSLRYSTVEAMARDIRRHLDHLPVSAHPGGGAYRTVKFIRRHTVGVATTALLALAVTGGLAGTAWQSHWRGVEAHKAEEVKNFVLALFSGVDPDRALGQDITARQLVEEGATRIESEFGDQPRTRAEILTLLADLFDQLGDQNRGLVMIEEAIRLLGPAPGRMLADALQIRGRIRISRGKIEDGTADIETALEMHRGAAAALAAAEDLDQLAVAAERRGESGAAKQFTEESLQIRLATLGRDHEQTANSYNNLGVIARKAGELKAAERYHRTALEIRRRVLPEVHPGIALSLNNLGALMLSLGRYRQAEDYFTEALDQDLALYGERHPLTITARNNIGAIELRLGRYEQAKTQLTLVLDYWRKTADDNHPNALLTRYNLAAAAAATGDFAAAENEFSSLLAAWRTEFGNTHYLTATAEHALGMLALEQGRSVEARTFLESALAHRLAALGESHPYVADSRRALAQLALAAGDLDTAADRLAETLAIQESLFAEDHPALALTHLVHGRWLLERGEPAAALAELERNLVLLAKEMTAEVPEVLRGRLDLATARLAAGQPAKAGAELATIRDILAARFGAEAWQTAVAECRLAEALSAGGESGQALSFARHAAKVLADHDPGDIAEIAAARQAMAEMLARLKAT